MRDAYLQTHRHQFRIGALVNRHIVTEKGAIMNRHILLQSRTSSDKCNSQWTYWFGVKHSVHKQTLK